jgi:hypothetical protein
MEGFGGELFCCSVFMANLVMLFSSLTSRSYQCMSNFGIVSKKIMFHGCICVTASHKHDSIGETECLLKVFRVFI